MTKSENTESVQTHVSREVKASLRSNARRHGLTDAAYVRTLIIADITRGAVQRPVTIPAHSEELS